MARAESDSDGAAGAGTVTPIFFSASTAAARTRGLGETSRARRPVSPGGDFLFTHGIGDLRLDGAVGIPQRGDEKLAGLGAGLPDDIFESFFPVPQQGVGGKDESSHGEKTGIAVLELIDDVQAGGATFARPGFVKGQGLLVKCVHPGLLFLEAGDNEVVEEDGQLAGVFHLDDVDDGAGGIGIEHVFFRL